jgi:formate dehydrogenase assembly factor FdhD
MKICSACRQEKALTEFHRLHDGYQWVCKECRRRDSRARYKANPERRAENTRQRRRELREWATELKRDQPCVDCHQSFHPAAMHWYHVRDSKEFLISDMTMRGLSRDRILGEIAKCELVCANCSAVRTYERRVATATVDPTG